MPTFKTLPVSAPVPEPVQRLGVIYAGLRDADRYALLAFAEFLAAGGRPTAPPGPNPDLHQTQSGTDIRQPTPPPRPAQETVIAAIRRLTLTYPMLDRAPMLHDTAALMSAHVLHGRTAVQVIDELEALFLRYDQDRRANLTGGLDDGPHGAG